MSEVVIIVFAMLIAMLALQYKMLLTSLGWFVRTAVVLVAICSIHWKALGRQHQGHSIDYCC